MILTFINILSYEQKNAYPWIAALLRDEDIDDSYVNSECSAVLVCVRFLFAILRSSTFFILDRK